MERVVLLVWVLVVSIISATQQVQSGYYIGSEPYKPVHEKTTTLRFFFQDTQSGNKPTAVRIAGPNPMAFGTTFAIDDLLTEGFEITSKVIGNARGMYVAVNQQDKNLTFVMYVDLGFTTGEFKGSSLSMFSRNPALETNREMAIVGGRGRFRFAKGFVNAKTHFLNLTSGDAIVEYNVVVVHPA